MLQLLNLVYVQDQSNHKQDQPTLPLAQLKVKPSMLATAAATLLSEVQQPVSRVLILMLRDESDFTQSMPAHRLPAMAPAACQAAAMLHLLKAQRQSQVSMLRRRSSLMWQLPESKAATPSETC